MPNAVSGLWGSVKHWLGQTSGVLFGHATDVLNIDDLMPPPKWSLREVHAGRLWRSSEPQGPSWNHWPELRARGIRSVVSLQTEEDAEDRQARAYGMKALRIPIIDNHPPTRKQVEQFLAFATRPENQPVAVHCRAGKGRTGVMVACYRIAVQGWTASAAVAEARALGLPMDCQERFIRDFARARAITPPR
jgi:protein tyrosine phosphatase (PTP) superfamily phosphohydrolase (DUF442 family)